MSAEPTDPRKCTLDLLLRVLGPELAVTKNVFHMYNGEGVSGLQHQVRANYFEVGVSTDGTWLFPRILGADLFRVRADTAGIKNVVQLWQALRELTVDADALAARIHVLDKQLQRVCAETMGPNQPIPGPLTFHNGDYTARPS